MTFLDKWIQKMERPAREEGKAEGIEIGIDWAIRKIEAEAKGLPFDEPRPRPPPEGSPSSDSQRHPLPAGPDQPRGGRVFLCHNRSPPRPST